MNGLFLHQSNQLEVLVESLAALVGQPLSSPFIRETVIVQSLGMRRWLTLELAKRRGICMNADFPFPAAFLGGTLRELVREMAAPEAFAPAVLTWKIHRLLPELIDCPEFEPVRRYTADHDALKLFQLASRLAHLFDQYLVYRPAMLLEWETKRPSSYTGDEAWQAILWRVINEGRSIHFGAALERLADGATNSEAELPERLSIFGISSLPPSQLSVFFHLAARCPVHIFLLAPSSEYHSMDLTPKQRARRGLRKSLDGNPLLTSFGRLNAQFTDVLLNVDDLCGHRLQYATEEFHETSGNLLLHQIQRDILRARNPATEDADLFADPKTLSADDGSIHVHVCHSEMREVEVIYDQLLAMFDADATLLPRDILVMTPEIEKYAPIIHAVFGYPENPSLRIPYSIADRHPRSESQAVDTFLRLLELPGSRCTAPELFTLLQTSAFRRKFRFSEDDLMQIRRWIAESGIRWGIDGSHRAEFGVPDFCENSWRHGLDRLLMGYAVAGHNRVMFNDVLPHDDVEGSSAELLGRMISAVEAIFETVADLRQPRSLAAWQPVLLRIVERFLGGEDEPKEVLELRSTLEAFSKLASLAESHQDIPFEVIREYLDSAFAETKQGGEFLRGGVTFCALKPMRSIPARVIWLMGMNDDAFPRKNQPLQFDLIARKPALGDRSVRDDDRYIFLEALISARDKLCISHIGRSLVDNEPIPPSVVVSELLEYIEQTAEFPAGQTVSQFLISEHPLQAFSKRYFQRDSRLVTFSSANAAAASQLQRTQPGAALNFIPKSLPDPPEEFRNIDIDSLLSFFLNPAEYFLKYRLGILVKDFDDLLDENEALEMDSLLEYSVRVELVAPRLDGSALPPSGSFVARGLIPPGEIGTQHFREIDGFADAFHQKVRRLITGLPQPTAVDVRIADYSVTGIFRSIYNGQLVNFRPSTIKVKDRLRHWIQHLIWCFHCGPVSSFLIGAEERPVEYLPVTNAEQELQTLLNLYWAGLTRPLPFFPESGFEYAKAIRAGKSSEAALEAAYSKWSPSYHSDGESNHAATRICFPNGIIPPEFEQLANAIYTPLLAASVAETKKKK